jgi:carboxyl-terminal processing protease
MIKIKENLLLYTLLIFIFGFFCGGYFFNLGYPGTQELSLIKEVENIIEEKFLFPNGKPENLKNELIYGAASGMVRELNDPYSSFFDPKERMEFEELISGEYEGIGTEIGMKDKKCIIIAPLKNSPAEKVGIKAGDEILEVDETPVEGLDLSEIVKKIKGKAGTKVKLKIKRDEKIFEIEIQREKIVIPSIELEVLPQEVAHFKIYHFLDNATSQFESAMKIILGTKIQKIILDLRNNSGGSLNEAVNIASYFLPKGQVILKEEGRDGKINEITSKGPGTFATYKIVVLINKGTASAAEILAGALKENLKVKLVGEKTFGKGTVQEFISLKDGSAIKLTTSRWLLPSGTPVEGRGLKPDIEANDEEILNKALSILK